MAQQVRKVRAKMTDAAKNARSAYKREWNRKNAEKVKAYHKSWRAEHPDKIKQYQNDYWERKAAAGAGDPTQ